MRLARSKIPIIKKPFNEVYNEISSLLSNEETSNKGRKLAIYVLMDGFKDQDEQVYLTSPLEPEHTTKLFSLISREQPDSFEDIFSRILRLINRTRGEILNDLYSSLCMTMHDLDINRNLLYSSIKSLMVTSIRMHNDAYSDHVSSICTKILSEYIEWHRDSPKVIEQHSKLAPHSQMTEEQIKAMETVDYQRITQHLPHSICTDNQSIDLFKIYMYRYFSMNCIDLNRMTEEILEKSGVELHNVLVGILNAWLINISFLDKEYHMNGIHRIDHKPIVSVKHLNKAERKIFNAITEVTDPEGSVANNIDQDPFKCLQNTFLDVLNYSWFIEHEKFGFLKKIIMSKRSCSSVNDYRIADKYSDLPDEFYSITQALHAKSGITFSKGTWKIHYTQCVKVLELEQYLDQIEGLEGLEVFPTPMFIELINKFGNDEVKHSVFVCNELYNIIKNLSAKYPSELEPVNHLLSDNSTNEFNKLYDEIFALVKYYDSEPIDEISTPLDDINSTLFKGFQTSLGYLMDVTLNKIDTSSEDQTVGADGGMEVSVRADAADALMYALGDDVDPVSCKLKEKCVEVICEIGRSHLDENFSGYTIYDNSQNAHEFQEQAVNYANNIITDNCRSNLMSISEITYMFKDYVNKYCESPESKNDPFARHYTDNEVKSMNSALYKIKVDSTIISRFTLEKLFRHILFRITGSKAVATAGKPLVGKLKFGGNIFSGSKYYTPEESRSILTFMITELIAMGNTCSTGQLNRFISPFNTYDMPYKIDQQQRYKSIVKTRFLKHIDTKVKSKDEQYNFLFIAGTKYADEDSNTKFNNYLDSLRDSVFNDIVTTEKADTEIIANNENAETDTTQFDLEKFTEAFNAMFEELKK